jgi:diacylglycerol O-acyltransferase / wax synthase
MRQLNTLDSLFIYMHQRGPGMSMAMLQVFAAGKDEDPLERYEKIVDRLKLAIPEIPMLHEKVFRVPGDADKPYWITEGNVDIDYHIRHLALPPPGNWDQLTEIYGQLLSLPMDLSMPLWRVYVIEGLNNIDGLPPNSYAIITKMHHASADGITAARVTGILAGAPLDGTMKPETQINSTGSLYDVMSKSLSNNLNSSVKLGRLSLSNFTSLAKWGYKSLADSVLGKAKKDKLKVPATRFNGELSPDRVYDSVNFNRQEVNEIRSKLGGATINDVALTICGGALREYLIHKRELPSEPLVAFMPISVRTEEVGGNQFAAARIPLGTHLESPIERLRSIQRETEKAKETFKGSGGKRFTELSNLIPSSILALLLKNTMKYGLAAKMPPLANLLVSSVPGSPHRIKFGRNEMVYMHGSPPILDGIGLIFGILGYAENMVINMTSCKQMVPDKQFMLQCLLRSYDQLKMEAEKLPLPKDAKVAAGTSQAKRKKAAPARKKAPVRARSKTAGKR